MPNKLTLVASVVASATCSMGIGALVFTANPSTSPLSVPTPAASPLLPAPLPASPEAASASAPAPSIVRPAPVVETVAASPAHTATPRKAPKHAKPKPKRTTKHASKPTEKPAAGSKGPFADAEGDGKTLDDLGVTLLPHIPPVPHEILPFPGANTLPWPHDPNWGDPEGEAADPGVVWDADMGEKLGVPVTPEDGANINAPGSTWDPTLY